MIKNNSKTIYWKTGHSYIKRKVNYEKALAGFEKVGISFLTVLWVMVMMMVSIQQFKYVTYWTIKIKK